ncbi:MAG: DHH family phosphoesterase [Thaumarchaeota archaeon]|nr:DHH family phosphoesterase [Nitrososphaerota archaeon]
MDNEAPDWKFPFVDPATIKRAVVICHRNADADSYLSAYAISALLRSVSRGCEVDLATPEGMTVLTAKLAEKFPHRVTEVAAGTYDLYVAVDVGDAELLKGWKGVMQLGRGTRLLVDHHPLRDGSLYDRVVVDELATSAAEVVFGLFEASGVKPDRTTAQALLEAIMFDSSHLAIATGSGLRAVVKLLDLGAEIQEAKKDLRSEPDYGEVLAKLKGAQRLKIYKLGEWVMATTLVGSFQAHVARSLVFLGADVAAVGGETDGETRVSLRSTQRFAERTGIQLGTQVAEDVGKSNGGHGGGHATAASLTAAVGEEEAMKIIAKKLSELVGSMPSEID